MLGVGSDSAIVLAQFYQQSERQIEFEQEKNLESIKRGSQRETYNIS